MNLKDKNWKTTIAALIAAIIVILTGVHAFIDGDPNTVADWKEVLGALATAAAIFGVGWFARDKDKSSEDVGVK